MRLKGSILVCIWCILLCSNVNGQNYNFPFTLGKCTPLETHDTITVTFVGDVMLHGRQLKHALTKGSDANDPNSYNFNNTFKYIKEQIGNSDIAVANMEFPVGIPPYTGYPTFSAPESIIWEAQKTGFNLFLLANNHILDKGKKGFDSTIDLYKKNNAHYIGAYTSVKDHSKEYPKTIRVKDIRVAFLNFTYGTNGFPVPKDYVVNKIDTIQIKESIQKAKREGADIIIATPHWGEEYQSKANDKQRALAQFMIDNGVNVIIGSHPHVTQDGYINNYNAVFYSLGNYISNQSVPPETQLGLMVTLKIIKNKINKDCYIYSTDYEYLWCFRAGEFIQDYTVIKIKDILNNNVPGLDSTKAKKAIDTYNRVNRKQPIKNYKQNIN